MTHEAAEAYACVAYRTMEYEGNTMSEEYLGILMDMLYGFIHHRKSKKYTGMASSLIPMMQS